MVTPSQNLVFGFFVFAGFVLSPKAVPATGAIPPPLAEQKPHALTIHGDTRVDEFYWLRERENPKVAQYLKAENAYLEGMMKPTKKIRTQLFKELKGRIPQRDSSVPEKEGEYLYYHRYEDGKEYAIHCRKKDVPKAKEEIILDVNSIAKGKNFVRIANVSVRSDGRILAYAEDFKGNRIYTIRFKDLRTGKVLGEKIENVSGSFVWAEDNRTIIYTKQNPTTLREEWVYRHSFGGKDADTEIYHEADEKFDVGVAKSFSRKYIFILASSQTSDEAYALDAANPVTPLKLLQAREAEHEFQFEDAGDRFLILTNWKAKNFRLMEAPYDKPSKAHWKELIPHRKDTLLESFLPFRKHMVLEERREGLPRLRVMDRETGRFSELKFKDPVYLVYIDGNREFNAPFLRFGYQSMTTPDSTVDYDFESGQQVTRKEQEVLGGFKSENYVSERLFAKAADGTAIPISLVYRKSLKKSPDTPLLILGYGSYGFSMEPHFDSTRLSLLDRGFVFAIAHVRGGSEMGRSWYENGKFLKKKNTFTDFIAVTEHLHKNGYSSPKHTYAMGRSAGGLLMGAVMNLRPELYNGIIAGVPFVDVLTTMLDASLPLTTAEYEEWGNPNDKKYYEYMKSYSPYDNIRATAYPNLLVSTGLNDTQVPYWEPAKLVAKLRRMNTGKGLVLLKTEMDVGHGGKSGRFERLKQTAMEYAFLLMLEGKAADGKGT
ncbi:MAG: S9 family peptidase [Bdellovibrionales bacterium]